jgi:SAM-dependent methyltransferase
MSANLPGFFQGTEMPDAGWWEALWPNPAGVLAAVGVTPGMKVIDLCAGNGWFTRPIARIARHVIAVDIDCDLLEMARRRLTESGLANGDFIVGDAYELATLVPSTVDYIFLANAFHGVPDRPRLAHAVGAALQPSGHFGIVNWHPRSRNETKVLGEPRGPKTELRMSVEATIEAAETGGLKLAYVAEVPPYHYGAVFERPLSTP